MRRKNGFTLVELMAILVILSVLLLVTVPSITKTFKDSSDMELEEYRKTLCLAAKTYVEVEEEAQNKSWTTMTSFNTSVLIDYGYINDNLKNPSTKTLDTTIKVQKATSGEFSCIVAGKQISI